MTDTTYLKVKMTIKGVTNRELARILGISECNFSRKLNNRTNWSVDQIKTVSKYLNLSDKELGKIFFS